MLTYVGLSVDHCKRVKAYSFTSVPQMEMLIEYYCKSWASLTKLNLVVKVPVALIWLKDRCLGVSLTCFDPMVHVGASTYPVLFVDLELCEASRSVEPADDSRSCCMPSIDWV